MDCVDDPVRIDVVVSEHGTSVGESLLGFGGKAGRSRFAAIAAAAAATTEVEDVTTLGATLLTFGLYVIIFGIELVTDVGATLLIGLRGGTARLPKGSCC